MTAWRNPKSHKRVGIIKIHLVMHNFEFQSVQMSNRQTWGDGRDSRCCPNEYIGCFREGR